MHCEIIDRYLNAIFVEIKLKKENLKSVFFGHPNRYTGLPNGLKTSLTGLNYACINVLISFVSGVLIHMAGQMEGSAV